MLDNDLQLEKDVQHQFGLMDLHGCYYCRTRGWSSEEAGLLNKLVGLGLRQKAIGSFLR